MSPLVDILMIYRRSYGKYDEGMGSDTGTVIKTEQKVAVDEALSPGERMVSHIFSEENKNGVVGYLVRDKMGQNKPIAPRSIVDQFINEKNLRGGAEVVALSVADATSIDQPAALRYLARQRAADDLYGATLAELCLSTKGAQVFDQIDVMGFENGTRSLRYMGFQFELPDSSGEVAYAREIMSGMALLAYDKDRKPIGILHTPVKDAVKNSSGVASATLLSPAEFNTRFGYSDELTLEQIDRILHKESEGEDNSVFMEIDKILGGAVNHSVIPLAGRLKFGELVAKNDSEVLSTFKAIAEKFSVAESAFLILDLVPEDKLSEINHLIESHPKIAKTLISSMIQLTEYADVIIKDSADFEVLPKLMAIKTSKMLVEVAQFYSEGGVLSQRDLVILGIASNIPRITYDYVYKFGKGDEVVLPTEGEFATSNFYDLLRFHREHPDLKEVYGSIMEFMLAVMLHRQKEDPRFFQGKRDKPEFYDAFNKGDQMNETTPTTNSEVDIARGYSAVMGLWNRFPLEKKEEGISLSFIGIGNGRRFEGPLVQMLEDSGVKISQISAVDLNDLSAQFPTNLAGRVRFLQGNITADGFDLEAGADVALLPWSLLSDQILEEEISKLMERVNAEWVIVDVPLPNGAHSYEDLIQSQLSEHRVPGVMVRSFEAADGKEISSMFNMYEVEELIYLFAQSGFVIENIPTDSAELAGQIKQIIADDSILGVAREAQQERNVWREWAYQTESGDNIANRATFVLKQVGVEEALKRVGQSRSIFSVLTYHQLN